MCIRDRKQPVVFLFGGSGSEPTSTAISIFKALEPTSPNAKDVASGNATSGAGTSSPIQSPFNLAFIAALDHFDTFVTKVADFTVRGVLSSPKSLQIMRDDREVGAVCLLGIEWSLSTAMANAAGVMPDYVLGYSLGEFAAAAVCGHISLPEAIALVRLVIVVARTAHIEGTGDMLSICLLYTSDAADE